MSKPQSGDFTDWGFYRVGFPNWDFFIAGFWVESGEGHCITYPSWRSGTIPGENFAKFNAEIRVSVNLCSAEE